MIMHSQKAKFGAAPYLIASNSNPQPSKKQRLTHTDLVLHVGNTRISFRNVADSKPAQSTRANNKPMDSQALASQIHTRFLAESNDWNDTRGVSVTLDDIPDPVAVEQACAILYGLGYIARPHIQEPIFEGDEPVATVWVEHRNY